MYDIKKTAGRRDAHLCALKTVEKQIVADTGLVFFNIPAKAIDIIIQCRAYEIAHGVVVSGFNDCSCFLQNIRVYSPYCCSVFAHSKFSSCIDIYPFRSANVSGFDGKCQPKFHAAINMSDVKGIANA